MTSSPQGFVSLDSHPNSFSSRAYLKKKINCILVRDSISMFRNRLEGTLLEQLLSLEDELIRDYLFSFPCFSLFSKIFTIDILFKKNVSRTALCPGIVLVGKLRRQAEGVTWAILFILSLPLWCEGKEY